MYLENLTEEIEEWLEKAEKEENLKFIGTRTSKPKEGAVVIEILGNYGSIGQLVAHEIKNLCSHNRKIAGFFSSYLSEMIQLSSNDILLPITLLEVQIGNQPFILTTCSFIIPDIIGYTLADELYEFYKKLKVSKILLIDGVHTFSRQIDKKPIIHRIISSKSQVHTLDKNLSRFTLMGQVASSFLTYWEGRKNIPIEIIAVDAFAEYDPASALELMKVLAKEWNVEGDFRELERRSNEFKVGFLQHSDGSEIGKVSDVVDPRDFI